MSNTWNEPACWSWPIPPLRTLDEMVADIEVANALLPADERRDPRAAQYHSQDGGHRARFTVFHAGRCAICACAVDRLVRDHCHTSGLIRGTLCTGCNVAEGRSGHPIFEAYRTRPPAVILGYREFYFGIGWPKLWWEDQSVARALTGDAGWTMGQAALTNPGTD